MLSDDNPNLVYLDCSWNNLSDINFITAISPQSLVHLNLRDNCFAVSKLEIFSEFSQIEELYLGTLDFFRIRFTQTYNQFYGSLKPLKELKHLRVLCLNNTEVNQGWEYLPIDLEELFIADTREKITGEDLGIAEVLEEIAFFEGDVGKWIESRKVRRKSLEKDLKTFQRLTDMWKEKYEQKTTELKNLQSELENLKIENDNYQIANELIREKYESMREKFQKYECQIQTSFSHKNG